MGKLLKWTLMASLPTFASAGDQFSITMGGDFGFNTSRAKPNPTGGVSNGVEANNITPYSQLTQNIEGLFDGDLNIINLESTVLAELPNAGIDHKKYLFSTHPKGVEHMADLGVDVFTLANNHIADYQDQGIVQSLENLDSIATEKSITHVGAGRNLNEAQRVRTINKNGVKTAIASIGIIDTSHYFHRASETTPGTLSFRNRFGWLDYERQLKELKNTPADYKILAVHYGQEGRVSLDPGQREKFLKAVQMADVDLIIGHHPHVVRPIEVFEYGGKTRVFAYSLGNLLHLGTGRIEHKAAPYNFGILGKLILEKNNGGRLEVNKMEIYPLLGTHHTPRSPSPGQCQEIIAKFNEQIAAQSPNNLRFQMSTKEGKCIGYALINPSSTNKWIEEINPPKTQTPQLTQTPPPPVQHSQPIRAVPISEPEALEPPSQKKSRFRFRDLFKNRRKK